MARAGESAITVLTYQVEILFTCEKLGLGQGLFFCANPSVLSGKVGRALPEARAITLIDVNFSVQNTVLNGAPTRKKSFWFLLYKSISYGRQECEK